VEFACQQRGYSWVRNGHAAARSLTRCFEQGKRITVSTSSACPNSFEVISAGPQTTKPNSIQQVLGNEQVT
jgi:hypothetical protein